MASLTISSVTFERQWVEGGTTGKDLSARLVTFTTLSSPGNGTATNPIPAAAFGLSVIEQASNFWNSTDSDICLAVPDATGANLLLFNVNQATDANRADPADFISKTMRGVVKGYV